MENSLSPEDVAKAVAQTMYQNDRTAQGLGIALKDIAPGRSVMTMRVTDQMLNGHNVCHGGYIFTLADTAFAYACNAYNQNAVAQGAQISFIKSVPPDSFLTAIAEERAKTKRTGLYDIRIEDENSETVALFRGNSHNIRGQIIPGLTGRE